VINHLDVGSLSAHFPLKDASESVVPRGGLMRGIQVSAAGRLCSFLFFAICALASVRANGQDLAAGKTPAQLFAGGCSPCHKSPQGLAKSDARSMAGFLRQHYTSNPGMADALAAYLAASGGAAARDRGPPEVPAGAPQHAALPPSATLGRLHGPHTEGAEGASSDPDGLPAQAEPGSGKRRPNGAGDGRKRRLTVHGLEEATKPPGHHAFAPTAHESSPIISEEHASPTGHAASVRKQRDEAAHDDEPKDGVERPGQPGRATATREPSKPPEHATSGSAISAPTGEGSNPSTSASPKSDDAAKNKTAKSDAVEEEKTTTRARAQTPVGPRARRAARSAARRAAPITGRPSDAAD
jgi:hypothetical protein